MDCSAWRSRRIAALVMDAIENEIVVVSSGVFFVVCLLCCVFRFFLYNINT